MSTPSTIPSPGQETAHGTSQPARVLSAFDAGCVVVGAIIGVGIFFTPASVARLTESASLALLAWVIAGFIALCGGLVFAELGARYNTPGAQYGVLRDAYGPFTAFLYVFCNSTVMEAGSIGAMAMICARNLVVAAGQSPLSESSLAICASVLIAGVITANILGVRWGSRIQNLTVFSKVLTLCAVIALALFLAPDPSTSPAPSPAQSMAGIQKSAFLALLAALVPTFFSYGGFQQGLWIAGEVKDPRRNLPRAILGGVVLVVIVYVAANWAYLRLLGVERVAGSQALASDAVSVIYPAYAPRVMAAAVAVSAFGVLNAQFLSAPRLLFGMARDRLFFKPFAQLDPRFGTPAAAIWLMGGLSYLVLWGTIAAKSYSTTLASAVDLIINGVMAFDGLFFAATGAALFIFRARENREGGSPFSGFRVPALPVLGGVFVLGTLGVVAGSFVDDATRFAAFVGLSYILFAAVIYYAFFRQQSQHADSTRCPNCGYLTRGNPSPVCPECGSATTAHSA